jgi:hypothetical protein
MRAAHRIALYSRFETQTGTKGSLRAGTKASWAAWRFWGDVAGMEAGTKGSRPKARFPLVFVLSLSRNFKPSTSPSCQPSLVVWKFHSDGSQFEDTVLPPDCYAR